MRKPCALDVPNQMCVIKLGTLLARETHTQTHIKITIMYSSVTGVPHTVYG